MNKKLLLLMTAIGSSPFLQASEVYQGYMVGPARKPIIHNPFGFETRIGKFDDKKITADEKMTDDNATITGLQHESGMYNPTYKAAYLIDSNGKKHYYYGVVEYKQAVTPPNISNPEMVAFATMPNPDYKPSTTVVAGGESSTITLFGMLLSAHQSQPKQTIHARYGGAHMTAMIAQ